MSDGWIKLHRKLIDSSVFDNPKLLKTWIWCLCKASHTEHEAIVGKQVVKLQEGQFIFGRLKAAEALNMNDRTVYDYMKMLQSLEMININSNNKFSVVTIVNWGFYQLSEDENQHQTTSKSTSKSTIKKHTNNNEEECLKNEKKHIYGTYKHVRLTDEEHEKLLTDYGQNVLDDYIRSLDEYIQQTGKRYKDHNLTIRKWIGGKAGKSNVGSSNTEQTAEYAKIGF